ncbi:MAG: hypothetical protein PVG66_15510 [Chromatiales bacterium]|jgi:hypothetical protein
MIATVKNITTANQRAQFIVTLLLLLVALGWFAYRQLPQPAPLEVINALVDPDCDLRAGPCETRLANGAVLRFGIEPRLIPLMQELTLLVQVSGMHVEQVTVETNGMDMDMGFNHTTLRRVGVGQFRGTADLSYCVRDAMQWQSTVQLRTAGQLYRVPFQFITVKEAAVR